MSKIKKVKTIASMVLATLAISIAPTGMMGQANAEETKNTVEITNDYLLFDMNKTLSFTLDTKGTYSYSITNSLNKVIASGTVKNSSIINVKKMDVGFYTMKISKAGKLVETNNFGVINKSLSDNEFYSVATHYGQNKGERWNTSTSTVLNDLGFGQFRDEIYWKNVETKKGKLTIPTKDTTYSNVLKSQNIPWIFVASYGNALYEGTEYSMENVSTQKAYAKYVNYVLDQRPEIKEVELYNEFNNTAFNKGCRTGTCYANFVKTVAPLISKKHPNVTLIGGATASSDETFFHDFVKAGGMKHIDYWSFHPYAFKPADLNRVISKFNNWQDDYNKGDVKKRVKYSITEFGWSNSGASNVMNTREGYQASALVEAYVNALNNNDIESFTWYDGVNDGSDTTVTQGNFGLLATQGDGQWTPKKSAVAFNSMRTELEGYKATGITTITKNGKNIKVYSFKNDKTSDIKYVANVEYSHQAGFPNDKVSMSLKELNVKKDLNFKKVEVTDYLGNKSTSSSKITIGNNPVFIENVSQQETFKDVKINNLFYNEIEEIAGCGITTGWKTSSGSEYRPLNNVNRDAMIVFVYRAMGSPSYTPPKKSPFVDVKTNNVYYKEIAWAYSKGIIKETKTSKGLEFRPLQATTREDMILFVYRAMGSPSYTPPKKSPFIDVKTNYKNYKEIAWAYEKGISTGWSTSKGKEFRPLQPVKRDATAAFIVRWLYL